MRAQRLLALMALPLLVLPTLAQPQSLTVSTGDTLDTVEQSPLADTFTVSAP
jgi:hypothetical protein